MNKVLMTMIQAFKTGHRMILTIVIEMIIKINKMMTKIIQAFQNQ